MSIPFSMPEHRRAALSRLVHGSDPARALRAIEALARMDAGSYGFCMSCGMRIPEAWLEARPERRHCAACEPAAAA